MTDTPTPPTAKSLPVLDKTKGTASGAAKTLLDHRDAMLENSGKYSSSSARTGWFGSAKDFLFGPEKVSANDLFEQVEKTFDLRQNDEVHLGDKLESLSGKLQSIIDGKTKDSAAKAVINSANEQRASIEKLIGQLDEVTKRGSKMKEPYKKVTKALGGVLKDLSRYSLNFSGDLTAENINAWVKSELEQRLADSDIKKGDIGKFLPSDTVFKVEKRMIEGEERGAVLFEYFDFEAKKAKSGMVGILSKDGRSLSITDTHELQEKLGAWASGMEAHAEGIAERAGNLRDGAKTALEQFDSKFFKPAQEKIGGKAAAVLDAAANENAAKGAEHGGEEAAARYAGKVGGAAIGGVVGYLMGSDNPEQQGGFSKGVTTVVGAVLGGIGGHYIRDAKVAQALMQGASHAHL